MQAEWVCQASFQSEERPGLVGLKEELMEVCEASSSVWSKVARHVSGGGVFPRGRNELASLVRWTRTY